ncbi:Hint domain-containing protein [Roseobacter sp. YSTF-M11]|uniref:Hint domain-containing protein n=1 Tax=Roseobacter insulae TaxID=2859783 RepID=A0A9X1FUH3_9RHOB|nr:Hint domain-containing protein [Roseobacter insulae]MBW4707946.1 Hint domain-containing protein [Roseobacter insulae]
MPRSYGYTFAIFGTQTTTDGGALVDYRFAPSGTWRWEGTDTYFVIEEASNGNRTFNGDPTNETISSDIQIGARRAQTVDIDGTDRQVMWDYTFEVTDGTTTWRVGVIDVDLNNDDDTNDALEDGYFLVFPDGMPPEGVDLTSGPVVENDDGTSHAGLGGTVVCFAAGTLIETSTGPRPVESLAAGDMILTRDAGLQPLRWTGSTQVPALGDLAPIVISAGVMGNDSDVIVSPQHALLVEDWRAELLYGMPDVLVRAVDLLTHDGIYRRPGGMVTYCHILFDAHHLVQASGLWSESLYPGDMTLQTVNPAARQEIETLFPDLKSYGPKAAPCLRHFEAACLTP